MRSTCSQGVSNRRHLLGICGLLTLLMGPLSGADAQECGGRLTTVPVPEFVGQTRVWPNDFQPVDPAGQALNPLRDSADYVTFTFPVEFWGHELFQSVKLIDDARLYATYSNGIQVWDVSGANAEAPVRLDFEDGFNGDFFDYGVFGESDTFIVHGDALNPSGGVAVDDIIALAGEGGTGFSIWQNDGGTLTQLYQDCEVNVTQVRVAELNGAVFAFAATTQGVEVYDVNRALNSPCRNNSCSSGPRICSPAVRRGVVGDDTNQAQYIDVIEKDGKLYVVASDGRLFGRKLDIWELSSPGSPAGAVLKYDGSDLTLDFRDVRGSVFFDYNQNFYLAFIANNKIEIVDVDTCLDANGCIGSLPASAVSRSAVVSPGLFNFLTVSKGPGGAPFLYYGLHSNNIEGPGLEQLLDLTNLGGTNQIHEVTESGGTFTDPCNGMTIDYWGYYNERNDSGFNNHTPRYGVISPRGFFYRATQAFLDIHLLGDGSGAPTITTVATSSAPYWFDLPGSEDDGESTINFQASAQGCQPGADNWQWTADDLEATGLESMSSTASVAWEICNGDIPCPNKTVEVWALNDDCPMPTETRAQVTLSEPRPHVSALAQSPSGDVPVCSQITFTPTVSGRAPFTMAWQVLDAAGGILASVTGDTFQWDTTDIVVTPPDEIFSDGFESGDVLQWGQSDQVFSSTFDVQLTVNNDTMVDDLFMAQVTLTPLGPLGLGNPPILVEDLGSGSFNLTAQSENATEWRWEIEDPQNGSFTEECQVFSRCEILDFGAADNQIGYTWGPPNVPGMYGVHVSVRNCAEGQDTPLTGQVQVDVTEVVDPEPPVVVTFDVDAANSPDCDCGGLGDCFCAIGRPIQFTLVTNGEGDTLEVDFDNGAGFQEVTVPVRFTYPAMTFPTPKARARRGGLVSPEVELDSDLFVSVNP